MRVCRSIFIKRDGSLVFPLLFLGKNSNSRKAITTHSTTRPADTWYWHVYCKWRTAARRARAAHGALPHGGGKFPGSEGGSGTPFQGSKIHGASRRFVVSTTGKMQTGWGYLRRDPKCLAYREGRGYDIHMPYKDPERERRRQALRNRKTETPRRTYTPAQMEVRRANQNRRRAEYRRLWTSHRGEGSTRLIAPRPCPDKCEVCGNPPGPGRRLDFDHCHLTERFRGWLCNPCNMALGCAKDQSARLRRLADYLDNFYGIASRS